jgi:hypothetical protein
MSTPQEGRESVRVGRELCEDLARSNPYDSCLIREENSERDKRFGQKDAFSGDVCLGIGRFSCMFLSVADFSCHQSSMIPKGARCYRNAVCHDD